MELRRDSCGLSGLLGRRVVDASGRSFGRVYEVRGRWQRDEGLRIDHLLLSPQAADSLDECDIDKTPRNGDKPSDHTPIWCSLDL